MILLLIIFGVILIVFIVYSKRAIKMTTNTIVFFGGTLGAGKTFLGVKYALQEYNNRVKKWKFRKFILRDRFKDEKPLLYSNIPIEIKKGEWSTVILPSQLLMKTRIVKNSVLLLDEIGDLIDQYSYNNEYIVKDFLKFVRYFRQTVNGRFIATDQSIGSVNIEFRRRVGKVYSLSDFKLMFFRLFYKVDVNVLMFVDETLQNINQSHISSTPYFFGWKGKTFKRYDSFAYSSIYNNVPMPLLSVQWSSFKIDTFLTMPFKRYDFKRLDNLYNEDYDLLVLSRFEQLKEKLKETPL